MKLVNKRQKRILKVAYDMSYQDWIPDEAISYDPSRQQDLSSRIYGMIGADTSGDSYVHFRGFGPEFKKLMKEATEKNDYIQIGDDLIIYPNDGYALGLLKKVAIEGRKLGFQYGAEIRFRAINQAIDPFSDGTIMGHVKKNRKNKIASNLSRVVRIAQKLFISSSPEKEVEKVLKEVLPGTEFENKAHAVGGYIRDQIFSEMFPQKGIEAKDLDIVVEMKGGAKKITDFLHKTLKNRGGSLATHRPHQIGAGYPIWSLQFFEDESGDVEIDGKSYKTSGGEIEFADTQKEAFPDPTSRQRVTTFGTLEEDIKRRDFTTNMLLKDMTSGEIKDLTGVSKSDIKKGVLRGHPEVDLNQIFADDPLRMVRLIRFKVKYDWDIPDDVKAITRKNAHRLNILSAERLRDELIKMMKYGKLPEAISLMKELGFDKVEAGEDEEEINPVSFLLKELKKLDISHESPHHIEDDDKVIDHTINVIKKAKNTVHAQLAALLHDIGKSKTKTKDEETGKVQFLKHEEKGLDIAEDILRRLKFDSKTINKVVSLIKNHMRPHNLESASDKALRKFIREVGDDLDDILDLAKADSEGKNPPRPYIDELRKRIDDLQSFQPQEKIRPVLNGKEIMETLNIKTGPKVGEVGAFLLDLQDENPNLSKEEAKQKIIDRFKD